MIFIAIALILWLVYYILLKKRLGHGFRPSIAVLPLVLFSYLVTLDLGINYIAGAVPQLNDGIALHSHFAYYLIGDEGWSIERFKNVYNVSFGVSLTLSLVFAGLQFFTRRSER